MNRKKCILIFDAGKTNKKTVLFDLELNVLEIKQTEFPEAVHIGQNRYEDPMTYKNWITGELNHYLNHTDYEIVGVNASGFGATLIHLNNQLQPLLPIEDYLNPYSEITGALFKNSYASGNDFFTASASPWLGNLNAGFQLFRIKTELPDLFGQIKLSVFLPQYLMLLAGAEPCIEFTSLGCHTMMYDFTQRDFHDWVKNESINKILPLQKETLGFDSVPVGDKEIKVGRGIHDSSAALLPYLMLSAEESFILLSTGTWSIALNPFNRSILSTDELEKDCLMYLSAMGSPVKASRLFLGKFFESGINIISKKHGLAGDFYKDYKFEASELTFINRAQKYNTPAYFNESRFEQHMPENPREAYLLLNEVLACMQTDALALIAGTLQCNNLYVDGGFAKNEVFLQLLANKLPNMKVYAAEMNQASCLGAALALLPEIEIADIKSKIQFKRYHGLASRS